MQKLLDFEIDKKDITHREGLGISNLDGRLWGEVGANIGSYFGDEALVRARVGIEARYLLFLSGNKIIRHFSKKEKDVLLALHKKINKSEYLSLRKIEAIIRHDVMVMVRTFKKLLKKSNVSFSENDLGWIHWGLSSEDVDNLARSILISNYITKEYIPTIKKLLKTIYSLANKTKSTIIQGRTHLQPATPTLLGKEIALFGIRIVNLLKKIEKFTFTGKLTGATGNLSAQSSVYPNINWLKFSSEFVESFGLKPNLFTTQIEDKDNLVEFLGLIEQVNSVLMDLSQDMRIYTGFGWFNQEAIKSEVGSSAMPQKINPIDFENSYGNSQLSNWIISGLRQSLPISWLQRDLTDKTIQRNLGLPFGYSLISIISSEKGVSRITPNIEKIKIDLYQNPEILAEFYQVNLRAIGKPNAYEELKKLLRGKNITKIDIDKWINTLDVSKKDKEKLINIKPETYIGVSKQSLSMMLKIIKKAFK